MGSGFPCWRLRASHQDPVAGESQDTGRVEADSRSNQDVGDGSADLMMLTMRDTPEKSGVSHKINGRGATAHPFSNQSLAGPFAGSRRRTVVISGAIVGSWAGCAAAPAFLGATGGGR